MAVLAFTYANYYCNGIKSSLAGMYNSELEAKDHINGSGERSNLEILDLETLGITRYKWELMFESKTSYDPDLPNPEIPGLPLVRHFLKKRWDDKAEWFEVYFNDSQNRWNGLDRNGKFTDHHHEATAGFWKLI